MERNVAVESKVIISAEGVTYAQWVEKQLTQWNK
jgi:hypothetical protein